MSEGGGAAPARPAQHVERARRRARQVDPPHDRTRLERVVGIDVHDPEREHARHLVPGPATPRCRRPRAAPPPPPAAAPEPAPRASAARSARVTRDASGIARYSSGMAIASRPSRARRWPAWAASSPGSVRQQARVDVERPGELLLLAQQPAQLEQHLPVPRQVGLEHRDGALAVVTAREHLRERQPHARHLRRRRQRRRVGPRRRLAVAALERGLGLRHAPLGDLQLQRREPLAHHDVVRRHGRGPPVEVDRPLQVAPPDGERAHAHERRHVLRALRERRGEGLRGGRRLTRPQARVAEAGPRRGALGVAAQQLLVALDGGRGVARLDLAPRERQRRGLRLGQLARQRRRVDVLLALRQRRCDPLRARADGAARPPTSATSSPRAPHASCSRYRSSARSDSSASSSTSPSSTSWLSTRPEA